MSVTVPLQRGDCSCVFSDGLLLRIRCGLGFLCGGLCIGCGLLCLFQFRILGGQVCFEAVNLTLEFLAQRVDLIPSTVGLGCVLARLVGCFFAGAWGAAA